MRRLIALVALVVLATPTLAGAVPIERWAFDEVTVVRRQPLPTLVAGYEFFPASGQATSLLSYQATRYRPRGFGPGEQPDRGTHQVVTADGGYAGYDLLAFDVPVQFRHVRDDAIRIDLTRPACVGVLWLSDYTRAGWARSPLPKPSWMAGYTQGKDVVIDWPRAADHPERGAVELTATTHWTTADGAWIGGSVVGAGQPLGPARLGYWLLLAERQPDGSCLPSEDPPVPAENDAPVAGAPCPDWLHALHVDDEAHGVWHPQIDPVYWCNYGHDHGADPGVVTVPFGLVGHRHGVTEDHFGFKIAVFGVLAYNGLPDTTATVMVHQGSTAGVRAACARFHEVHIVVTADDTGEPLLAFRLMADFGAAVNAKTGAALVPEACPDQAAIAEADGSRGTRQFPVLADQPNGGYEPWTADFGQTVLGLGKGGAFVANTFDPVVMIDVTGKPGGPYPTNVVSGASGTGVFLQVGNFAVAPMFTGTRWTDPLARSFVEEGSPGAVEQYVSPRMTGKTWIIPWNKCSSPGFGRPWECGDSDDNPPAEREDSIPSGGPN